MGIGETVKVLVIDDNQNSIESVCNYFNGIPEVEIIRCEIDASKIKKAIISHNPNILLLEVEKLSELDAGIVEEIMNLKSLKFNVILFSNNNLIHLFQSRTIKNTTNLLTSNELKITIRDYIKDKDLQNSSVKSSLKTDSPVSTEFIAFQTLIGLRFINKRSVVYFEYSRDEKSERSLWAAYLDNAEIIKLKLNTTSKDIMKNFENHDFIQISQSNIVNMNFFSSIELKSRKCILHPPFENKEMIMSRAYLNEIKGRFEID